jgi:methylmalonyl-CoA/ethylmalonyl-CoA epimerase
MVGTSPGKAGLTGKYDRIQHMDEPGMSASFASIALSWVPQGTFHHVGFVVASIQNSAKGFAESLEAEWDGVITHDPNQVVRVAFLRSKSAADPLFELIEPAGEKSPVIPFLKKGGGLHHLCYEVPDLDKQLEGVRSKGSLITRPPMPAEAFGGRRIAWVYTRSKLLIEYLERAKA